ncbi:putative acetyltransferase [Robiginitalea myxolifaciens]|uniref:Putative acetyltransferase n=1 Tax=Robiginitalea myxolifaciens TaxID=400055 RepID=A0A1I6GS92_9FLAO|nr:GNAT family N-acetyltransferase [Robiginitalea myxolifaciens]SFR44961.1 putative acetyltransferase [Robiginitalea myxolifaciens]
MDLKGLTIRPITRSDNTAIAGIIRSVMREWGAPEEGSALSDPELDRMFETYEPVGSMYWVVADGTQVLGGAGIAPLAGGPQGTCELQKMYFRPELRGKGMGATLIGKAMEEARKLGYRQCYIETMPYMDKAMRLYERFGFEKRSEPLGNTGHTACQVWLEKTL